MAVRALTGHTRSRRGMQTSAVTECAGVQIARSEPGGTMTMPGMLDMNSNPIKPRRSQRSRFITKMFAVGVLGALVGGAVAIVQNAPEADAASQVAINRYIRSEGGVAPCTEEDGSGQPGTCVWWAGRQGNGDGYSYLAVPDGRDADDDDDIIYITGPKAVRY